MKNENTKTDNSQTLINALAEIERLRSGLADAIDCVESWSAYASDYFKQKHDLDGDITRLRGYIAMPAKGEDD